MFCSNCGTDAGDAKFCSNCGSPVGAPQPQQPAAGSAPASRSYYEEVTLWEGKPAGVTDKAKGPLNTSEYRITNQRIIITQGIIGKTQAEVELHRIKDINVKQSLGERVTKVGDIIITSDDPTLGDFFLNNVPDPIAVKEIIRKAMMDVRANLNIVHHEHM